MTVVYFGKSPLHAGSASLLLNTRTVHVSPQYHVVFDRILSTVEHMRKGTVPGNCKNLVEEHSELSTQENFTLAKEWHLNKYSRITLTREA